MGEWESALDEALERLRKIEAATKDHTADGTPHGEPYCCCPLCDVVRESDLDEFLAKHQPPSCERCGDTKKVSFYSNEMGARSPSEPCPDCAPCGRCGGSKRVDDPKTRIYDPPWGPTLGYWGDKHCPDCAPCKRCGGEREIAKDGERYLAEMVPCPNCAEVRRDD